MMTSAALYFFLLFPLFSLPTLLSLSKTPSGPPGPLKRCPTIFAETSLQRIYIRRTSFAIPPVLYLLLFNPRFYVSPANISAGILQYISRNTSICVDIYTPPFSSLLLVHPSLLLSTNAVNDTLFEISAGGCSLLAEVVDNWP